LNKMTDSGVNSGKVVVVSGPSGVGKSTICSEVIKRLDDVELSISVTTRPPGKGEKAGEHYYFLSRDQFEEKIRHNQLLEYAEVFGHYYGTPVEQVDRAVRNGKTIILEIDVQGGIRARRIYPRAQMVFILPPNKQELRERMMSRGRDDPQAARKRLEHAEHEMAEAWKHYEHMIINENLEQAVQELVKVIREK